MSKDFLARKGKDGKYYPYTSPDLVIDQEGKSASTKFQEVNAQLQTVEQQNNSVVINVLYPPIPLIALKNDSITDNYSNLNAIVNWIIANGNNATIFFPPSGEFYFNEKITIDNSNLNLKIYGHNSKIKLKEGTTKDSFVFLKNINTFTIEDINFYSTGQSQTLVVEVNNANKIFLDKVNGYNVGSILKINFNYDYANQYLVKELITNNIYGENVRHLMHICNINKWDGYNIKAKISQTKAGENLKSVCFYMRPRCNNINLSNLYIEDCTGDVFHFNRADYTDNGIYPYFGTEGYSDNNIKINNITVKNFGNLVGFNSETNDITFNNVTCINQINQDGGIIYSYEGLCKNITINNFKLENIYRLIKLEHIDGGGTVTHRDFGTIKFSNGVVKGEFKSGSSIYGKIENYFLDNIVFENIDGNTAVGSLMCRFYKDINNISLTNLTFNLTGNHTRITELFRLTSNSKIFINNIILNRKINTTKLNIFSTYGIPTEYTNTKIYVNNSYFYNLGSDGGVYYGDTNLIKKSNCYINDVVNT